MSKHAQSVKLPVCHTIYTSLTPVDAWKIMCGENIFLDVSSNMKNEMIFM